MIRGRVTRHGAGLDTLYIDNRDQESMTAYLEARVDVLKRRVDELERQNKALVEANQEWERVYLRLIERGVGLGDGRSDGLDREFTRGFLS